jgi:hypothetical protein
MASLNLFSESWKAFVIGTHEDSSLGCGILSSSTLGHDLLKPSCVLAVVLSLQNTMEILNRCSNFSLWRVPSKQEPSDLSDHSQSKTSCVDLKLPNFSSSLIWFLMLYRLDSKEFLEVIHDTILLSKFLCSSKHLLNINVT